MPTVAACRIALVGDYSESVLAHRAIPEALRLAGVATGLAVEGQWVGTAALGPRLPETLAAFDAVWLVPASPYADTAAALAAVRFARERGYPFLGTCGGFQHALLEYAGAVWRLNHPAHAELTPEAQDPLIAPLACSLVEERGSVTFAPGSLVARLYGRTDAVEGYHCRYGLNPRYAGRLSEGDLRAVGWDAAGEVRAVELASHPFFVATLFQPERAALGGTVPPLVLGLVTAAATRAAAA